jgi:hypothetical protein
MKEISKIMKKEGEGALRVLETLGANVFPVLADPMLASDPNQAMTKALAIAGAKIWTGLFNSYKEKEKAGELKTPETDYPDQSLLEILQAINQASSDEDRINAMKAIFMRSIAKTATKEDEALSYQMMQICKNLTGEDILILKANYAMATDPKAVHYKSETNSVWEWASQVARQMGHGLRDLVSRREKHLSDQGLIAPRDNDDYYAPRPHSTFTKTGHARLTSTGMIFCRFMSEGEKG